MQGHQVVLRLRTGPGFYVRALARDLARALGTVGRLQALRRTRSGGFGLHEAVALDDLDGPTTLIPPASALRGLPAIVLNAAQLAFVRVGRLPGDLVVADGAQVKLLSDDGRLIAIAEAPGGELRLCGVFDSPQTSG